MGQGLGFGGPGQDEEVDARGSGGPQGAGGFESGGAGGHDVVDEEEVGPARGRRGAEGAVDVSPALRGREGRLRRRFADPRQESSEGPAELPRDFLREEAPGVVAAVAVPSGRGGDWNDGAAIAIEAAGPGGCGHEGSGGCGEDVVPPELQGVDELAGHALVPHHRGGTRHGRRAAAAGTAEGRGGRQGAGLTRVVPVEEGKRLPARTAETATAHAAPGGAAGGAARWEQEMEDGPPGEEGHGREGARHGWNSRREGPRLRKPDMHTSSLGLTRVTSVVNGLHVAGVRNSETGESTQRGFELELPLPLFDLGDAARAGGEARYLAAFNRTLEVARNAGSQVRVAYDAYRSAHDLARHYRDVVVPLRRNIAEESVLQYNGMLIGVFELLAAARAQSASVEQAIEAERDFWRAEAALRASLLGQPIAPLVLQPGASPAAAGGGH